MPLALFSLRFQLDAEALEDAFEELVISDCSSRSSYGS